MGGGLLQKDITRDTYRFAIKCFGAISGTWVGGCAETAARRVQAIEGGPLLARAARRRTLRDRTLGQPNDLLEPVFENGVILKEETFDTIRSRAETHGPPSSKRQPRELVAGPARARPTSKQTAAGAASSPRQ